MHLPVFICGFVCGWRYGIAVGFAVPLLRSAIFGMPLMFPTAVSMAVELAVCGLISALVYAKLPKKPVSIYTALISAMAAERAVGAAFKFLLLGLGYIVKFTFGIFVSAQTVPGIIFHLLLVPPIVILLEKIRPSLTEKA